MKKLLLALSILLLLIGCATPMDPVVKHKYIVQEVPDNWLQDCSVTAPPDRDVYLTSPWSERERLLAETNQGNFKNLATCNKDKAAIRKWKAEQLKLVKELEAKQQ